LGSGIALDTGIETGMARWRSGGVAGMMNGRLGSATSCDSVSGDGLVAHDGVFADLDSQSVEEHDRIHWFQRPGLPGGDFGHHLVGDRTDELGRDLGTILFLQKAMNLAYGTRAAAARTVAQRCETPAGGRTFRID